MAATPYPLMRRLLRALRLKHGLTQEQLAEKAGLGYKYYQRIELGMIDTPSLAALDKLGRVLKVKPWLLLCDDIPLIAERTGLSSLEHRTVVKPGRPKKVRDS
jgi:transcriptional regulator with XRE-family HTH domain